MLQGVKLSKTQCLTTAEDRDKMKDFPYASAIGSIMYAMLCTRPDVCLVGECSNFKKKILRTRKIMVMHSNERGECVHVPS